jgi:HEPN domain-containing protein
MADHEDSSAPDMRGALLEQIFQLWLQPELERRGLDKKPEEVVHALVVLRPDHGADVLIDADTGEKLVIQAKAARAIREGEPIAEADIEAIERLIPRHIDPDAAWIAFTRFKGVYVIAFDFRRNKAKAERMVERADEFLAVARLAKDAQLKAPAVENLHAAAELAVMAQMATTTERPPKSHEKRRRWFSKWTRLGNAPSDHGRALADLARYRAAARYTDGSVRVRDVHLDWLIQQVDDMIEYARKMIANWPGA